MPKKVLLRLWQALKLFRRWCQYFTRTDNKLQLIKYFYFLLIHPFCAKKKANSLFKVSDLPSFRSLLLKALFWDFELYKRLAEPQTLGLRLWEYGALLSNADLKGKKFLDIGVGTSLLPFYLADKHSTKVTALDLPQPMENPYQTRVEDSPLVNYKSGSVLKLPFKDESYDAVLAISTLEHLDANYQSMQPISYSKFIDSTKKAIQEMIRVTRPGGIIYITTDFYHPQQKTDRWQSQVNYSGRIGGAYKQKDLSIFTQLFEKSNLQPIGKPEYNLNKLTTSSTHSNYRGRYITTANFLYKKP